MTDNDDRVSPRTTAALREAMKLLLAGQSRRTDGRLTKANLGREAGISHATLHRAKTLLREWDAAVTAHGSTTPDQARAHHETATLRGRLNDKTRECADLRRQLNVAATVIATLHHENGALRAQLSRDASVIPIDGHRQRTDPRAAQTDGHGRVAASPETTNATPPPPKR